jgi:hypothetical protein
MDSLLIQTLVQLQIPKEISGKEITHSLKIVIILLKIKDSVFGKSGLF